MTTLYLNNNETINALKSMMNESRSAIICTSVDEKSYPTTESLLTREVDHQGIIWYIISSESITYKNLKQNNRILLIFTCPIKCEFLRIVGIVEISRSVNRISRYWIDRDKHQFKEGKTDSRIRLLKVTIGSSHSLKFPSNNMIDILKLLGRVIGSCGDLSN